MQIYCSTAKWVDDKKPEKELQKIKECGFDGALLIRYVPGKNHSSWEICFF